MEGQRHKKKPKGVEIAPNPRYSGGS